MHKSQLNVVRKKFKGDIMTPFLDFPAGMIAIKKGDDLRTLWFTASQEQPVEGGSHRVSLRPEKCVESVRDGVLLTKFGAP